VMTSGSAVQIAVCDELMNVTDTLGERAFCFVKDLANFHGVA
jgi:hypothetical protein